MRLLIWLAVGLIAGWFATTRWGGKSSRTVTIALGVIGAVAGGWLIPSLSSKAASLGASLVSSVIGAGVVLLVWKFYEIRQQTAK